MNKKILLLTIISVLVYAGVNFGHPVTPAFLDDINISERYFGILFSTMAFSLTLFSPFWGNKGDNYGRKLIIAIGIIGYGVGQIIFGLGTIIEIILIGRTISGIFAAAIFSNMIASFSEISDDNNRARNMSIVMSVGVFAGSIGYFIGGVLGDLFSPSTTLVIQGIFDILLGILILFIYPNTTVKNLERKSFIANIKHLQDLDSHIIYFLFTVTFWTLARNNVSKFLDVFLDNNGFNTSQIGLYVMITGIAGGIAVLLIVPIIAKRFKLLDILVTTLTAMIILIIISFTITNVYIAMYGSFMLYIIMSSIYLTVDQTFISKNTKSNFGAIVGVRESFKSFGLVAGPLIVTLLFKDINRNVFYFNAGIFILALIFLLIFIKKRKGVQN